MQKQNDLSRLTGITGVLFLFVIAGTLTARTGADEPFSVREYVDFHHVLHPLEHEALPAKDFQRIRSNSGELLRRGRGILRVGVPNGTNQKYVEDFRRELQKFARALDRLAEQSQSGSDEQVETSFSAVHDSFEMLAGMLPRKSSN